MTVRGSAPATAIGKLPNPSSTGRERDFPTEPTKVGILVQPRDLAAGGLVVIAPHGDDEIIGCGGWLLRRAQAAPAHIVFCVERDAVRRSEGEAALRGLASAVDLELPEGAPWTGDRRRRAVARIARLLEEALPAHIFVPNPADPHPDHAGTHRLLLDALDGLDHVRPEIVHYEGMVPLARASWWLDISNLAEAKLERLRCYRTQVARYRLDRIVAHLNAYRGSTLLRRGVTSAEAYHRLTLEEYRRCPAPRDS